MEEFSTIFMVHMKMKDISNDGDTAGDHREQ